METGNDQKLVSSWPNVPFVPESYVLPPEKRPGKLVVQPCKTIPVVDFEGHDKTQIIQRIVKAIEEFGFFQVQPEPFFSIFLPSFSLIRSSV